jgi:hypothetical protein
LHAGLVIIVPNVKPALQRQLFETALGLISERDLVNTVIEVGYSDEQTDEQTIDTDAIVILEVFAIKTGATPKALIATCRERLKEYGTKGAARRKWP